MTTFNIQMEFELPATAGQITELITDPAKIRAWSGEAAEFEKEIGGSFSYFEGRMHGSLMKLTDHDVVLAWNSEAEENEQGSEVHITFKAAAEGTLVIVQQLGLKSEEEKSTYEAFWDEDFFGPIEEYLWSMQARDKA